MAEFGKKFGDALGSDATTKLAIGLQYLLNRPRPTLQEGTESLKQTGLGAADQVTSLPAMVGAGYEGMSMILPPAHELDNVIGSGDASFSFMERLAQNPLAQATGKARKFTNEALGTGEPTNPGDAFLRAMAGNVLPLPTNKLTAPLLSGTSLPAKIARIATPVVKANDPGRLMGQAAFGGLIDAGANVVTDNKASILNHPTGMVLSDMDQTRDISLVQPAEGGELSFAPVDAEVGESSTTLPPLPTPSILDPNFKLFPDPVDAEVGTSMPDTQMQELYQGLEDQTRRAEGREYIKDIGKVLVGIGIAGGAIKYRQGMLKNQVKQGVTGTGPIQTTTADKLIKDMIKGDSEADFVATGKPTATTRAIKAALNRTDEGIGDGAIALQSRLRKLGYDQDQIDTAMGSSKVNYNGVAGHFIRTGELGQGTGITAPSLMDMDLELAKLSKLPVGATGGTKADLYNDTITYMSELSNRKRSQGKAVGLWDQSGSAIPTRDLVDKIRLGIADPEVNALIRKTNEWTDKMLDYTVARELLTPAAAQQFKDTHTIAGYRMYLPMYEQEGPKSITKMISDILGTDTELGKEMSAISNMYGRSSEFAGGVKHPTIPMRAMKIYAVRMIEAANKNLLAYETLTRLSNIKSTTTPTGVSLQRVNRNGTLRQLAIGDDAVKASIKQSDPDVRYIGKSSIDAEGNKTFTYGVNGKVDDSAIIDKFGLRKDGTVRDPDIEAAGIKGSDVVSIMHRGEVHRFLVTDHSLRQQLFGGNPALNRIYNMLSYPKAVGQALTTGKGSPFSLTVPLYNITNAATVLGVGNLGKLTGDTARGVVKLLKSGFAETMGDYASQRMAAEVGIWKHLSPTQRQAFTAKMRDIAGDNLIKSIRREQGRLATGLDLSGKLKNLSPDQIVNEFAPNFVKYFGYDQMHLVYRFAGVLNNAMHQSTAFGLSERMINDLGHAASPQEIRMISQKAGDIVGDVNSKGTGRLMDLIHATVPYSEPTIQAFRVLGRAAIKNPKKFAAAYATYIGVPTAMEQAYLESLDLATGGGYDDPETGQKISYKKYFWDNISDTRKASAFYFPIPGKHPKEGMPVPFSPEWGPGRGFLLDAMDATFNISGENDLPDINDENYHLSKAGVTRAFNIGTPWPIAASLAAGDAEMRIGPEWRTSNDPDDPGGEFSLFKFDSGGNNQRITRYGDTKNVNDAVDTQGSKMLGALFMAGAKYFEGFANEYKAGSEPRLPDTSVTTGLKRGVAGIGDAFMRRGPFPLNPLYPGMTVPRNKSSKDVSGAVNNMKGIDKDFKISITQGKGSLDAKAFAAEVARTQDPIYLLAGPAVSNALEEIKPMQAEIAAMIRNRQTLGNAIQTSNGKKLDLLDRTDEINKITIDINAKNIEMRILLGKRQEQFREQLREKGLNWNGNWTNLKPRASAPLEAVTPSKLPQLPQ